MTPAEAGFMAAISNRLAPDWDQRDTFGNGAYHYACADVVKAIAALQGCGWDPAKVTEFTRLLTGETGSTSWGAACQSCGATQDLDPVHRPAEYGLAARTEHYCHDPGPCAQRRHGHAVAISGIAS